ncbi:MAG: bifunctional 4-hydroxy-2-oxoglutarate aldolase/2-dehydro-3-deoxy-phosphogluconate aldolase [Blastocatellia bacterium]
MRIIERARQIGIIPVVAIPKAEYALPLAEALLAGGLPCAEITFRTAAAAESIAQIKQRFPELLLGAGTVLTIGQVDAALDAGAEFIVSPGSNPTTIDYCQQKGITIFPGVCTPTEIEMNLEKGIDVMKFFPAEPAGGVKFLKAICAPYKDVRFIPTGGIDAKNIGEYLALPQVIACGGSWMVKPELMAENNFAEVQRLAAEAVALVKALRT